MNEKDGPLIRERERRYDSWVHRAQKVLQVLGYMKLASTANGKIQLTVNSWIYEKNGLSQIKTIRLWE